MNLKKYFIVLVFWWAIVFPNLFFSEENLLNIESNNVNYRFWFCDVLTDN